MCWLWAFVSSCWVSSSLTSGWTHWLFPWLSTLCTCCCCGASLWLTMEVRTTFLLKTRQTICIFSNLLLPVFLGAVASFCNVTCSTDYKTNLNCSCSSVPTRSVIMRISCRYELTSHWCVKLLHCYYTIYEHDFIKAQLALTLKGSLAQIIAVLAVPFLLYIMWKVVPKAMICFRLVGNFLKLELFFICGPMCWSLSVKGDDTQSKFTCHSFL